MGDEITLDKSVLTGKLADAAADKAKSYVKPALDLVETIKDSGFGGSGLDKAWKWLTDLVSTIVDWIKGAAKSVVDWFAALFTGSSTPTPDAPAAPEAPAKGAGKPDPTPEPPSPGPIPAKQKPDPAKTATVGGR